MKRLTIFVGAVAALSFFVTMESFAQGRMNWRGSGGWGMGAPYGRLYNQGTVETISGSVQGIRQIEPMKGMYPAIEAIVKTDKETIPVHLGPEWYITRLDTKIEKGDAVEIKGSRVMFADKPIIIAAEVKKGDQRLLLRDSAGIPVWAGWRR